MAKKPIPIRITEGDRKALDELVRVGYNFTRTAVFLSSLRETWKRVFPDRPYPDDEEKEREA